MHRSRAFLPLSPLQVPTDTRGEEDRNHHPPPEGLPRKGARWKRQHRNPQRGRTPPRCVCSAVRLLGDGGGCVQVFSVTATLLNIFNGRSSIAAYKVFQQPENNFFKWSFLSWQLVCGYCSCPVGNWNFILCCLQMVVLELKIQLVFYAFFSLGVYHCHLLALRQGREWIPPIGIRVTLSTKPSVWSSASPCEGCYFRGDRKGGWSGLQPLLTCSMRERPSMPLSTT